MGFKSFLLLIILVFLAIFSIQNLQSISLVFFGFKSLTLPLSFWIILSLLAGIISSLLVQFLSRNSRPKTTYNQSFPSPPPTNYPPSPPVRERFTPPTNSQTTNSQRIATPQVKYESSSEDEFDIFDEPPTSVKRDRQIEYENQESIKEQPVANFSTEKPDISSTAEPDVVLDIPNNKVEAKTHPEPNSVAESKKSPVAEPPSEAWLKAREASLYSYQPREKTEIKTPKKVDNVSNRSSDSTYSRSANGIYDVPYRVIPPSQEPVYEDNDDIYYDDEDDDWDF